MDMHCARAACVRFILLICLLISFAPAAFAQAGRGSISGLVTDSSGAIIPGTKVVAQSQATGSEAFHRVDRGRSCIRSFLSLPGQYQVTASAKGFETLVEKNITVSVDQVTTVNLDAEGRQRQRGRHGQRSHGDWSRPAIRRSANCINADTIDRVPLLTRNVYDLIQLSAGVTPANGAPNSSSSFAIENISSGRPGRRRFFVHDQRRN